MFSFRKRFAVFLFFLVPLFMAGFSSLPALAQGTPVMDNKSILQQLMDRYEKIKQWVEEQEWIKKGMELRAKLSANSAHAEMRGASALAQRHHWQAATRRRVEVMERTRTDRDICRNVRHSMEFAEADAHHYDLAVRPVRESFEGRSAHVLSVQDEGVQERHVTEQALRMLDECSEDEVSCVDAHGLLTGTGKGYLTEPEMTQAKRQIELLVDPHPRTARPQNRISSLGDVAQAIRERRRLAILSMSASSLAEVAANYASVSVGGGDYTSRLSSLRKFATYRFGSSADNPEGVKFQALIANADTAAKKAGDDTMPAEVQRKQAAMDAFQTRLALMQYEQSLRVEALTATMLALQVNPL